MQKHYGYNIEITHNSCNIIYSNNSLVIVKITYRCTYTYKQALWGFSTIPIKVKNLSLTLQAGL